MAILAVDLRDTRFIKSRPTTVAVDCNACVDDEGRTAIVGENEDVGVNGLLDAIAGIAVDIDEIKPFLAVGAVTLFIPDRIVGLLQMCGDQAAALGLVLRTPGRRSTTRNE